jgi:hypothetical protein
MLCILSNPERREEESKACTEQSRSGPAYAFALYQGTALQLAEKLLRAVGRGFIPGITHAEKSWALAPEVCFIGC